MRLIIFFCFAITLFACQQNPNNILVLQNRVDSLSQKVSETYTPGMGEFMGSIQTHHSKLWFAGQNQNWQLANFEVHEMTEALENIQKYNSYRTEAKNLNVLTSPLKKITIAIENKNMADFKNSFILITNTCNVCHKAMGFGFNVVKIPVVNPFNNQDFSFKK